MAHDVFISYSHTDRTIADAACHKLEESGIRCWYAPRDIRPGDDWAGAIIEALEKSKIMVLIFTDSSNVSTQVNREVSTAVSNGTMILPLKCTNNLPTASMRYYLSTVHWMDAIDSPMETAIDNLASCIQRILNDKPEPEKPIARPTSTPIIEKQISGEKTKKKQGLIAAASAVILAIVILAILLPKKGDKIKDTIVPTEGHTVEPAVVSTPEKDLSSTPLDDYALDEENDSPGTEFYLYTVSNSISDVYDQAVILEKYFGEETEEIILPAIVDGLPVVGIGEKCFEDNAVVKKVVLPDTLEYIGYRAFYGCSALKDINFPNSLTYTNGWCFAHSGLEEFIAPPNFDSLGYGSFYSCEAMKNVVLTEAVQEIGADTFAYLADGCTVTMPNPNIELDIKAFREEENITLIAVKDSAAETYAKAMKLNFQAY